MFPDYRIHAVTNDVHVPAAQVFAGEATALPEMPEHGYGPIRYREEDEVGFLHFAFYSGAMSTAQCEALRAAYKRARARPTRVLVLTGGPDYWSNGIHLGQIEAADSPADESWRHYHGLLIFTFSPAFQPRQTAI